MEALFLVFRDNINMKLNGVTEIDRRNIKGIVKKITAFDCFRLLCLFWFCFFVYLNYTKL